MNSLTALHSNIPLFVVLVIGFAAVFMAYRFYRESDPPVKPGLKYVLISLRALVLGLIILVALNPRFSWSEKQIIPRRIGVYIDRSGSMGIKNDTENRADSLRYANGALRKLLDGYSLQKQYFNTALSISDTLPALVGGTDFNVVFNDAVKKHWDALILISDGIRSVGSPPILSGDISPIFTIGLGKKKNTPDILIKQVDYAPRVFQGSNQNIRVHIANRAVNAMDAMVRLYEGKVVVARRKISIGHSDSEQNVVLNYSPKKAGIQNLHVTVSAGLKEQNTLNNRFDFIWDVKKSAIRVGMIAMAPNIEYKFFNLALSQNKDFKRIPLIALPGVRFTKKTLDSLDVMVWQDFPTASTTPAMWQMVRAAIKQNNPGLIIFLGPRSDRRKINEIAGLTGSIKTERRLQPVEDVLRTVEPLNPLADPFQAPQTSREFWTAIPPLKSFFDIHSTDKALISMAKSPDHAVLLADTRQGRKHMFINIWPFWKARFALYDQPAIATGYNRFIQGVTRWAADRKKQQQVVLESDQKVFFPGREAVFSIYIYDVQGHIVHNGHAVLMAEKEGRSFRIPLQSDTSGVFRARYAFNESGVFRLKAEGLVAGVSYGAAHKRINVLPYNPEFSQIRQDTLFLKQLAAQTGGVYVIGNQIGRLRELLGSPDKTIRREREVNMRYNSIYLFVIISLLSLEWILRKRVKLI